MATRTGWIWPAAYAKNTWYLSVRCTVFTNRRSRFREHYWWTTFELGDDAAGGPGPDEGARGGVVLADVARDDLLEIGDGLEDTPSQTPSGQRGEEALDGVEPGRRGRREVDHPARVPLQQGTDLGVLVGGVVVGDCVDQFARRDGSLDRVEEAPTRLRLSVSMSTKMSASYGASCQVFGPQTHH